LAELEHAETFAAVDAKTVQQVVESASLAIAEAGKCLRLPQVVM
jgi:hypothetical protein